MTPNCVELISDICRFENAFFCEYFLDANHLLVSFSFSLPLGTIAIDLDRKMVFNEEKDANIWKPPAIDKEEVEEVKKYASPAHQVRLINL